MQEEHRILTHLSPAIRCRLRIGLDVGVRSRCLPACSNSSSAFVTADGSTGSECRSAIAGAEEVCCRFDLSVGGVFDSGGDINEGVIGPPVAFVGSAMEMGARSVGAMMCRLCCVRLQARR
jgi:hypothetical protein